MYRAQPRAAACLPSSVSEMRVQLIPRRKVKASMMGSSGWDLRGLSIFKDVGVETAVLEDVGEKLLVVDNDDGEDASRWSLFRRGLMTGRADVVGFTSTLLLPAQKLAWWFAPVKLKLKLLGRRMGRAMGAEAAVAPPSSDETSSSSSS